MIKTEYTETYGWEAAIRGMRNPLNSHAKSDSTFSIVYEGVPIIGEEDKKLMMKLARAGSDHRKFMRQIIVSVDITAPLYFWKEFDTYKVGTVANSESTMHTIHKKEFSLNDFSCEHLFDNWTEDHSISIAGIGGKTFSSIDVLTIVIQMLNHNRAMFLKTGDKQYWHNMIQMLPSSFNQKRTVTFNYEVLHNMYHARLNHKLDEWRILCRWIEALPYNELITE